MKNRLTERSANSSRTMLLVIAASLLLWGVFHAIGTFASDDTPDWRKPIIVLVCTFSFLGFWGWLLYRRGRGD